MSTNLTRRQLAATLAAPYLGAQAAAPRPNLLWITCEDMGPHLHACGDEYSVTPHLDRLSQRGMLYRNAWSNAPVCAPARTTIISGVYPSATGAEHMRSMTKMPAGWKMFPGYLREAGYYCANNSKEDYNLEKPPDTWDDSSKQAHWKRRAPGQPFFSVFNLEITHESQIRRRPHTLVHDPAKARVPAYHPDMPEVRHDWAQYYDNITTMDQQAGALLAELDQSGQRDDTIVVFFGDHGSGMPRNKRWPYNCGLNVSIVVSIPEKFRHLAPRDYRAGAISDQLVGFVDLAPSMLNLAGLAAPAFYQGQAFLGAKTPAPRRYLHGFRGRMDERADCVRSVRDQRYVYVRNYMPHKIYGQHLAYMWETPTTRVWERLYQEGKLNAAQRAFWERKPAEELYDLREDRDEVRNLAGSPAHAQVLARLRQAHREHTLRVKDVGLLPESEMQARAAGGAPYDMGHDAKRYPAERVFAAAELAAALRPGVEGELAKMLTDGEAGVRYWGALGLLMRGTAAVSAQRDALEKALTDPAPSVVIAAAEALAAGGPAELLPRALEALFARADPVKNGAYTAGQALAALDALGAKAAPLRARLAALPQADPNAPARVRTEYIKRLLDHLQQTL